MTPRRRHSGRTVVRESNLGLPYVMLYEVPLRIWLETNQRRTIMEPFELTTALLCQAHERATCYCFFTGVFEVRVQNDSQASWSQSREAVNVFDRKNQHHPRPMVQNQHTGNLQSTMGNSEARSRCKISLLRPITLLVACVSVNNANAH